MAERRMLSKSLIQSDNFIDLQLSAQALYMHLSVSADDDGFLSNAKTLVRMIGASVEDLESLIDKNFVLRFDNGVIVIRHWRRNNYIQKDRYKETVHLDEKSMLEINPTDEYILKG